MKTFNFIWRDGLVRIRATTGPFTLGEAARMGLTDDEVDALSELGIGAQFTDTDGDTWERVA